MMNKKIIGHSVNLDLLSRTIDGDSVHHGFLFSGPEQIGKYTIARSFADNIVNNSQECAWDIYNRIDSDIYIIEPEQIVKKKKLTIRDIPVDAIIRATQSMALAPDKSAKVLIIDDAHRMTIAAQNALLKSLEEPRDNRYIILVTHNTDRLLQTIQSRCFNLPFDMVGIDELDGNYDDEFLKDMGGRPGFLERVKSDDDFRDIVIYARKQLQELAQKKVYERLDLASELSKKDDEYLNIFLNVWIYRIWAAAHKTKKFQLVKVADKVEMVLNKMQLTNVNKQLALEDLLLHIV